MTLLNGWDPAGLLAAGAPRNEYDFIIEGLLDLLSRHVPESEVASFLEAEISQHFGVRPQGAAQFAKKAVTWFEVVSAEE